MDALVTIGIIFLSVAIGVLWFLLIAASLVAMGFYKRTCNAAFFRGVLLFPVMFPLFLFTAAVFIVEQSLNIQSRMRLTGAIDKWLLDPLTNFIEKGKLKCS